MRHLYDTQVLAVRGHHVEHLEASMGRVFVHQLCSAASHNYPYRWQLEPPNTMIAVCSDCAVKWDRLLEVDLSQFIVCDAGSVVVEWDWPKLYLTVLATP